MAFNGASAGIRRPVETRHVGKCNTFCSQDLHSIDVVQLLAPFAWTGSTSGFFARILSEPAVRDQALEPRDFKLAFLGDALERFTGTLDPILIVGSV